MCQRLLSTIWQGMLEWVWPLPQHSRKKPTSSLKGKKSWSSGKLVPTTFLSLWLLTPSSQNHWPLFSKQCDVIYWWSYTKVLKLDKCSSEWKGTNIHCEVMKIWTKLNQKSLFKQLFQIRENRTRSPQCSGTSRPSRRPDCQPRCRRFTPSMAIASRGWSNCLYWFSIPSLVVVLYTIIRSLQ